MTAIAKHTVVIIGAGTGGISTAARLRLNEPELDILLIDPSHYHDYQPAWTLVGGGTSRAQSTRRRLHDCLPDGVRHRACAVARVLPEQQQLELEDGSHIAYEYLVIAAGIRIRWDAIEGLEEALGKNGVTSNYRYDLAPYTWELVRHFRGGTALFTQPAGALKCPGAPQKALYLAADHFRRRGAAPQRLEFRSGAPALFGIPFYARPLEKIMAGYGARSFFEQKLVQIRGDERIAVFEHIENGRAVREEVAYDLLHVVPPQSAPAFIADDPSLSNAQGWLDVDPHTLRHTRYPNIFGLGDCTSSPNSKTAAAIRGQAPVVASNLLALLRNEDMQAAYDGYAACPITVSKGRVLLAEFSYDGVVTPSFPLDPRTPRRIYWWLKCAFLPWFYWQVLLKGHALPVTHKPLPMENESSVNSAPSLMGNTRLLRTQRKRRASL